MASVGGWLKKIIVAGVVVLTAAPEIMAQPPGGGRGPGLGQWNYSHAGVFGHLKRNNRGQWHETNSSGASAFFEESGRTSEYLELTDFSRGFVWRLYDGYSYLKGPNFAGNFNRFVDGQWRQYKTRDDRRVRWSYGTGLFVDRGGDNWNEIINGGGQISFVEVDRRDGYVELVDFSRGFIVRLGDGYSYLKGPNFQGGFVNSRSGNWVYGPVIGEPGRPGFPGGRPGFGGFLPSSNQHEEALELEEVGQ